MLLLIQGPKVAMKWCWCVFTTKLMIEGFTDGGLETYDASQNENARVNVALMCHKWQLTISHSIVFEH